MTYEALTKSVSTLAPIGIHLITICLTPVYEQELAREASKGENRSSPEDKGLDR